MIGLGLAATSPNTMQRAAVARPCRGTLRSRGLAVDAKLCVVCGVSFSRHPNEKPATFRRRKRCGFYCRPVTDRDKVGRGRAKSLYPEVRPCEVCGRTWSGRGSVDRHHRNSDRLDNRPENIAFLCRLHHSAAHRMSDGKVGGGARPRIVALMRDRAAESSRLARGMLASGATRGEVADAFGVHPTSVSRWLKKYPA